jgi:hypothetical protein
MNILIKLMSIVSLVIAPTLATMDWGAAAKPAREQITKEMSIIKADSGDAVNLTVTADANALKAPADALIAALVADKLIEAGNYSLSLSKGKLTLDDKEQSAETTAKYKTLIDALGGADLNLKNTNK